MSDIPSDLVLLAQVWECNTDQLSDVFDGLVSRIEREFKARTLSVNGKAGSSTSTQRMRVRSIDCKIEWIGPPGTTDYRPCAEPIVDPMNPDGPIVDLAALLRIRDSDRFYDLAIARADWERLLDETMASLGFVTVPEPQAKSEASPALPTDKTATAKRDIPKLHLLKYLRDIKEQGGPAPAADPLVRVIAHQFPQFRVTRPAVRAVHKEVFGKLPPGKRSRQRLITP
jgi:hypothetical protein